MTTRNGGGEGGGHTPQLSGCAHGGQKRNHKEAIRRKQQWTWCDCLLHDARMNDLKALLRRYLIPLCALLLLLAAALAPQQEKKHRLRVAPGLWPGSEGLLLAQGLKLLPPTQFQFIEIPWPSAVMRALGSGAADVAVTTLDSVARMREAGQEVKVLMVLDQSSGADAVVASQNIPDMQSLKGRKVGVDLNSSGAYLLINALEDTGMKWSDILVVPMIQPEIEQAMQTHAVDAVVASEPWLTSLHRDGLPTVYDSKQMKNPILRVLVATDRACEASQDNLVALLKMQVVMTGKMRSENSFDGMQSTLRREKMNAEEFASCLERLHPLNQAENTAMLQGEHPQLMQISAQMEAQMIRCGLLKSQPGPTAWIDPDLFKEASR